MTVARRCPGNPKQGRFVEPDLKKQSQSRPLAGNPKHECRNPKQGRFAECDLKKQSQFADGVN
jgi:hypothetical protein